ncbi:MAG: hypothetical protein QM477_09630 [Planctomycetota bacterium]
MGRVLATLFAATMLSCSATVTADAWGDLSSRLALALKQAGAELQTKVNLPFQPGSPELLSIHLTGETVAQRFDRQVLVWQGLDRYSFEMQRIFNSREIEATKVKEIAHAFHDLHRQLLLSGIAPDLGLSVEAHKRMVQKILQSPNVVSSLESLQPAINVLCTHLAKASLSLTIDLDHWQDTCLRQIDSKWRTSLDGYAVLLSRKRSLEQDIAAQAAGATGRKGDPAGELLKVETLLRNSEGWRNLYSQEQEMIALAFQAARTHVQKNSHAILEWGIAHREITKAIRSHSAHANTRLLNASANELAPKS